jgi:hypothetical protein
MGDAKQEQVPTLLRRCRSGRADALATGVAAAGMLVGRKA